MLILWLPFLFVVVVFIGFLLFYVVFVCFYNFCVPVSHQMSQLCVSLEFWGVIESFGVE